MDKTRKKSLEKQGYRLVGNHSAVKSCLWCKKAIRGEGTCYKFKFYGIKSWCCIQSSVSMDVCSLRCLWCWRDVDYTINRFKEIDEPKEILDGLIREHKKALEGYYGYDKVDKERLKEISSPKHVALSLAGENCLYPKLPELIEEIHKRGMTSFLVSNGTVPGMLNKLLENEEPTQMYVTLPAPNEEVFRNMCKPIMKNGWEKIMESLKLLQRFKRSAVRLTLVKGLNMLDVEGYAKILKGLDFKFLELKAGMPIGYARHRMEFEQMPEHSEVKDFSERLAKLLGWKIIDEKKESRVVLLMKEDFKGRVMEF